MPRQNRNYVPLIFSVVGIGIFYIFLFRFPEGIDFQNSFHPAASRWLEGWRPYTSPYDFPFYNAPWLLFMLTLLQGMGAKGASAGMVLISIAGMIAAARMFLQKEKPGVQRFSRFVAPLTLAVCLFNLHTFDLVFRSQVDVFVLLGVVLLYQGLRRQQPDMLGWGWILAAIRPTSVSLVLIYAVVVSLRGGYFWRSLRYPLLVFIISLFVFGIDWVWRYIVMIKTVGTPPPFIWITTLWHAAEVLQVSLIFPILIAAIVLILTIITVWRFSRAMSLHFIFAFLTVASLIIAPYALSYHYSVLMVIFVPLLLSWNVWLFIPIYLLTLTPILRLPFGAGYAWIDMVLPIAIWLFMLARLWRGEPGEQRALITVSEM